MAQKLLKYYEFARQEGGMQAQMRLAMMTGIASTKAGEIPDSPEAVTKFATAIKEITGKVAPI
jgi:hypothetical protein